MKKSTEEEAWEKYISEQLEDEEQLLRYAQTGVVWLLTFCLGLAIGYQSGISIN